MTFELRCKCLHDFPVRDEFAGTMVSCPHCGREMRVPALRRRYWWVRLLGAAAAWGVVAAAAFVAWGAIVGTVGAVLMAGLLWLAWRVF